MKNFIRGFSQRKAEIIIISILVCLFFLMLFFPLGNDTTIYLLAGKTIANGGKIYVDYVDNKPPLFYYIWSVFYLLSGYSEICVRACDFFWQLAAALSIIFVFSRLTGKKAIGLTGSLIYSVIYVILQFGMTMHCENLAVLPSIWMMYFHLKQNKTKKDYLLSGVMAGIIASLKFTMGIVLPVILLDELLADKEKRKGIIINLSLILLGFLFLIGISSLPFLDSEIRKGYFITLAHLQHYSANQPININLVKTAIKSFGNFFGDGYSLSLTLSLAIGGFYLLKNNEQGNNRNFNTFRFIFLQIFFLLFTIFYEKKFIPYHFIRLYPYLVFLSACGIYYAIITNSPSIKLKKSGNFVLIPLLIGFFLFFSPITRVPALLPPVYYYFTNTEKYDRYYGDESIQVKRTEYKGAGEIIKKCKKPDDRIIVMSIGSTPIVLFSDAKNYSGFASSLFYFSNNVPQQWKNGIMNEVIHANWIVVQTNDVYPALNGHLRSSWESLQLNSTMIDYINTNFYLFKNYMFYKIFRKKEAENNTGSLR